MAAFTFFFHPMSRAQIARWAFHEVKADYEPVLVDWANKPAALLEANPMGKLPTILDNVKRKVRHIDAGCPRKTHRGGFPARHWPVIIWTGELGDAEPTIRVDHHGFRACASERCAWRKNETQVIVALVVLENTGSGRKKLSKTYDRRNGLFGLRKKCRVAGFREAKRA